MAFTPVVGDPNAHKVTYKYDYLGRRVEKAVYNWVSGAWQAGPVRRLVWSGWLLLEELDGSANVVRKYTWGLDVAGQMGAQTSGLSMLEGAGGIGGLLAVSDPNDPNDPNDPFGDFVYFYDGNGNVGQVVDLAHDPCDPAGAIVAKYEYDPYGQRINYDPNVPEYDQPWRFSTKQFDAETGLGYWGYRCYSPGLGRWISRDPTGEAGGANLQAYVFNDPGSDADPLGLFPCERVVANAPSAPAQNAAFRWLADWYLKAAFTTGVTAGSGSSVSLSQADTWQAIWARPYSELFKCCVSSGVQYLWGNVSLAHAITSGRVSSAAEGYEVLHISAGVTIPGTPASLPVASAYFRTTTQEAKNALMKLALGAPPSPTTPIFWASPVVGPAGMTKLVDHIGCDSTGTAAPWPGTAPSNVPPTAPPKPAPTIM